VTLPTRGERVVDWFLVGIAIAIIGVCSLFVVARAAYADDDVAPFSVRYRTALEQAAVQRFGIDAPVALLAAQIQAESGWNPRAKSPYAQGLAQFAPATAKWLPEICPDVGEPDPWDPYWSLKAIACYDHYLYSRVVSVDVCNRWAFALSDYNGGSGWREREQQLAVAARRDPKRWFGSVENYSARGPDAYRENRNYVRLVLLTFEPRYVDAGWAGEAICR
jgi:soluble lytic murein transglycosylase-like protein